MVNSGPATIPLSFSAYLRSDLILEKLAENDVGSIIEVGAGQGAMGVRLAAGREYLGYEPDLESFSVAQSRLYLSNDAEIVNSRLPVHLPSLRVASFDALVAFEVLEHQLKDGEALRSWVRWVRPGGLVMISVPAHAKRFNAWDLAVGHHRRYGRRELTQLMMDAGLEGVEIYSYGFPLGYVLEWVRNHIFSSQIKKAESEVLTSSSGRHHQPIRFDALRRFMVWPFRMIQMPFRRTDLGTGYVACGSVRR